MSPIPKGELKKWYTVEPSTHVLHCPASQLISHRSTGQKQLKETKTPQSMLGRKPHSNDDIFKWKRIAPHHTTSYTNTFYISAIFHTYGVNGTCWIFEINPSVSGDGESWCRVWFLAQGWIRSSSCAFLPVIRGQPALPTEPKRITVQSTVTLRWRHQESQVLLHLNLHL